VINLLGYPTAGTEIYVRLCRKPPQLPSTMAGPTMAGRPCQPTNPPPKRYKPPILTKARPPGNLPQRDIQTKISSPYCGAGTNSYAASYRQFSTKLGKPTMTPITRTTHPTLQQNTVKYKPKMFSKKITTTTTISTTAPTKPYSDKPLPAIHHHRETTQMTKPTNPLPYNSVDGRYTIKTDTATKRTGTHPAPTSFPALAPSRNPNCSTSKNHPIIHHTHSSAPILRNTAKSIP